MSRPVRARRHPVREQGVAPWRQTVRVPGRKGTVPAVALIDLPTDATIVVAPPVAMQRDCDVA